MAKGIRRPPCPGDAAGITGAGPAGLICVTPFFLSVCGDVLIGPRSVAKLCRVRDEDFSPY